MSSSSSDYRSDSASSDDCRQAPLVRVCPPAKKRKKPQPYSQRWWQKRVNSDQSPWGYWWWRWKWWRREQSHAHHYQACHHIRSSSFTILPNTTVLVVSANPYRQAIILANVPIPSSAAVMAQVIAADSSIGAVAAGGAVAGFVGQNATWPPYDPDSIRACAQSYLFVFNPSLTAAINIQLTELMESCHER